MQPNSIVAFKLNGISLPIHCHFQQSVNLFGLFLFSTICFPSDFRKADSLTTITTRWSNTIPQMRISRKSKQVNLWHKSWSVWFSRTQATNTLYGCPPQSCSSPKKCVKYFQLVNLLSSWWEKSHVHTFLPEKNINSLHWFIYIYTHHKPLHWYLPSMTTHFLKG